MEDDLITLSDFLEFCLCKKDNTKVNPQIKNLINKDFNKKYLDFLMKETNGDNSF